MHVDNLKDSLRRRVREERAALPARAWAEQDAARTGAFLAALPGAVGVVAAYASRLGEPGTTGLVDALVGAGVRVLLPVLGRLPGWAWFTGWVETEQGWGGIPQPVGERLGASAIAEADLVIVPCLAVGRDGTRLGTGGGWYDRVLPDRRDEVPVWALARSREVFETLPTMRHDVAVDAVVTEDGWTDLGRSESAAYHG